MQTGPLAQSPRLSRVAGANQSRAATRETLTAWAILNSPRGQAKKALASGIPSQNELVKEELHNQMVRMRDAFIRIDPRLEGCISRHMVGCTLKAGGMELTKEQLNDALFKYVTGDGKFNWKTFCSDVEKARTASWSEARRLKAAKTFEQIDADGSGRLSRDELALALKRLNVKAKEGTLNELFDSMDENRDGRLDLPEFIDGLATQMVMPSTVFDTMTATHTGPYKLGGVKYARPGASPR